MKKLAYEVRVYDYDSPQEAMTHSHHLRNHGWEPKVQNEEQQGFWGRYCYNNGKYGKDEHIWSVEYSRMVIDRK